MQTALASDRREYLSHLNCRVSYYLDTSCSGRPLVLIHSINAAPSAFEMKPIFEQYRGQRPVYAIELPGFGFSERSNLKYSPEFYAQILFEFINTIVKSTSDVIAFSLSSEFIARAILQDPKYVKSLALISPTGLSKRTMPNNSFSEPIRKVISFPPIGNILYFLLTSKKSIKYYLNLSFINDAPEEMVNYAYVTSHQPGAKHVPFYFLTGQLFTKNACEILYKKITIPTLVLYDQDANISFELLPDLLKQCTNWSETRIQPTMGVPQWEEPEKTFKALDTFWKE